MRETRTSERGARSERGIVCETLRKSEKRCERGGRRRRVRVITSMRERAREHRQSVRETATIMGEGKQPVTHDRDHRGKETHWVSE